MDELAGISGPWRLIEDGFDIVPQTIYAFVVVLALLAKGHQRAAIWATSSFAVGTLAVPVLKQLVKRERPPYQVQDHFLAGYGFPSGHATHTALLAMVLAILVHMFVRRATMRITVYVALSVVTAVVAFDRLALGRHYLTDVSAGIVLGAAIPLLIGLVYSPQSRSHALKATPLVNATPAGRNLAVVLNPIKVEDVAAFKAIVTSMALAEGWEEPTWHFTTVEDPGTGMAAEAAEGGADLVMVCGGDGTVREVCAELAGTGIPVGVVPAGTGNLLARNTDVPLYLRAAIDVALTGQDRAIDLVAVRGDGIEDTHFLVMAGMGMDAAIMEGVNDDIKKRIGWLAYVLSALKALMTPAVKVEIQVDGGDPTTHRARTVVVGNVGFLQAGMPLMPEATIDDGLIDVVLLHPKRLWSWIPLAWRVMARRPHTDELVNRFTGRTVVIRAEKPTPRQLDGDSVGAGTELRMQCLPGRLLLRVPRS
ncbi:MAG: diacylglycerol kinase family protein [Nocardioides sp.]